MRNFLTDIYPALTMATAAEIIVLVTFCAMWVAWSAILAWGP